MFRTLSLQGWGAVFALAVLIIELITVVVVANTPGAAG